jgi:hypothetical protein
MSHTLKLKWVPGPLVSIRCGFDPHPMIRFNRVTQCETEVGSRPTCFDSAWSFESFEELDKSGCIFNAYTYYYKEKYFAA